MISAKTGAGLETLKEKIAEALQENYTEVTFRIPFSQYGLIAQIRPMGKVISEAYTDEGTELTMSIAREDAERLLRQHGSEIVKAL